MRARSAYMAILLVSCSAYSQQQLPRQSSCCLPATTTQYEPQRVIFQKFPANGPGETAWGIVWSENHNRGLRIEAAYFWRKPPFTSTNALQVLGQTGLSDVFVPYHIGTSTTRLKDLHWGTLHAAIPDDAGACGTLPDPPIVSPNDPNLSRKVLVKEIRDRGVAWTSDRHTRRGEELVLWATYDAGNYEYVMEYTFRDDGVITCRLGSTGFNNPGMPFEPHMHDALWRVNVDLGGSANNTVMVMEHAETVNGLAASDTMIPFNGGFEGGVDWNDRGFTHLNISNQLLTNAQGHPISYDLMPLRAGTARHLEDFAHHDFWVTHENPVEDEYTYGFEGWAGAPYVTPAEPVANTDITIWYMSSNHHHPRDEDFEYGQPIRLPGVALLMWSGFDLYPRNLFDDTPIHTPICSAVPPNLAAWWPFDELSGATAIVNLDSAGQPTTNLIGTPHPGAVGGTGPVPVSGAVHGALQFNGINQYVEVANNPALNFGTGDFSIDAWLKTTQGNGTILDKRKAPLFTGYGLFLSGGKPGLQLAVAGGFTNYVTNVAVADGQWHHLVVSVTRTATIRWFIDGNEAAPNAGPRTGSLTNSSALRVGVRSVSLSGFWAGTIDEIELFNRALNRDEVFGLYAAGSVGKCR